LSIEGHHVAETSAIRAGRAFVEIFAEDSQMQRVLARVSVRLTAFGQGLAKIGAGLAGVGTAVVTPFLTAAKVFADVGSELVDMSQRTGASVEALSELAFAADQTGTSLSSLETGIKFLQKRRNRSPISGCPWLTFKASRRMNSSPASPMASPRSNTRPSVPLQCSASSVAPAPSSCRSCRMERKGFASCAKRLDDSDSR
jgi:hypothetical protein